MVCYMLLSCCFLFMLSSKVGYAETEKSSLKAQGFDRKDNLQKRVPETVLHERKTWQT